MIDESECKSGRLSMQSICPMGQSQIPHLPDSFSPLAIRLAPKAIRSPPHPSEDELSETSLHIEPKPLGVARYLHISDARCYAIIARGQGRKANVEVVITKHNDFQIGQTRISVLSYLQVRPRVDPNAAGFSTPSHADGSSWVVHQLV